MTTDSENPQTEAAGRAPVRRGFTALPCPLCGERDAVSIDLADLTGAEACTCRECQACFSLAHVRHLVAQWGVVFAWVDVAPALEG